MAKLLEVMPEDVRGKEWAKPFLELEQGPEAFAQVFKKLDGAETLIGKRPVVPAKDAKDEDLSKFFEQWRPEKPEDYEIPLEKDVKPDEAFIKSVRQAFLNGNISKVQARGFLKTMQEYGVEARKAALAVKAKAAQEFDTLSKAALGAENKAVMERVHKAIIEHAPAVYKGQLDKIDDKMLLVMAGVIDSIMQKYVPADKLKTTSSGGASDGADTPQAKRAEAMKLMASKEYTNPMDPQHEATKAKVQQLYKEVAAAGVTA